MPPTEEASSHLGLPNCSLNRRSFRGGLRSRCAIEITGSRGAGEMREREEAHFLIGGPIKKYSLGSEHEIAFAGRGRLARAGRRPGDPNKTPRLPGSLFSRALEKTPTARQCPRRSLHLASGRHGGFCKKAAARRPKMTNPEPASALGSRKGWGRLAEHAMQCATRGPVSAHAMHATAGWSGGRAQE